MYWSQSTGYLRGCWRRRHSRCPCRSAYHTVHPELLHVPSPRSLRRRRQGYANEFGEPPGHVNTHRHPMIARSTPLLHLGTKPRCWTQRDQGIFWHIWHVHTLLDCGDLAVRRLRLSSRLSRKPLLGVEGISCQFWMSLSHAARYSESWGSLIHISNVAFISDRGHWHRTLNWIWRFVTCFPMPAINLAISASLPRTFSYDRIGSAAFISCCIASNMWLDSRNASLKWRSSASPIIGFWLSVLPLCNTIVWFLSLKWASMEASGNKWEQVHCFRAFVLMRLNQTLGCQLHITKCRGWLQSKDSKSGSGRNWMISHAASVMLQCYKEPKQHDATQELWS